MGRENDDLSHDCRLVQPDEGKVLLNDEDLTEAPIYQRARAGISYLPQESSVFRRLTVEDNLYAIWKHWIFVRTSVGNAAKNC
jgi:ABC-type lipopolysaccharide export system ATPase subunit